MITVQSVDFIHNYNHYLCNIHNHTHYCYAVMYDLHGYILLQALTQDFNSYWSNQREIAYWPSSDIRQKKQSYSYTEAANQAQSSLRSLEECTSAIVECKAMSHNRTKPGANIQLAQINCKIPIK